MAIFKKTTIAILLAAIVALPVTLANPVASQSGHPQASFASVFTPEIEATARPSKNNTEANYPPGPPFITITVMNHHTQSVSTAHARAVGTDEAGKTYPDEIGGMKTPAVMSPRATAEFSVPTGWSGRVAAVEHAGVNQIIGDESLIEANYRIADDPVNAVFAIDVSYVDGFSLPITCSCDNPETGCNINLWPRGCPAGSDNGVGSCRNPLRGNDGATSPVDFFLPCAGKAYTFETDHAATSFAQCQGGHVTCCIGTDCPAFNGRN